MPTKDDEHGAEDKEATSTKAVELVEAEHLGGPASPGSASSGPAGTLPAIRALEPEGPLLAEAEAYRERLRAIQGRFVDEPLYAVESAGRLLAEVLGELASTFATKRNELEAQWRHGGDTSTEELRLAFQAYRSFFNRVVST